MNGFIRKAILTAMVASLLSCTSHPVEDDLALETGGQDAVSAAADDVLNEPAEEAPAAAAKGQAHDDFAEFDGEAGQHAQASQPPAKNGDQDLSIEDELSEASGEAPAPKQAQVEPAAPAAPVEEPFAETAKAPVQEAPIPEPQIIETAPAPEIAAPSEPIQTTPIQTAPSESRGAPIKITNLKFKANDTGGTVIVEADKPVQYTTRFNADMNQFVVEVENAYLPEKLKRSLNTKDIAGSFGAIDAYQNPGATTARFVVQLRPGVGEPAVQVEGNSLLIMGSSGVAASHEASNGENGGVTNNGSIGAVGVESVDNGKILASQNLAEYLAGNTKFFGKKVSIETNNMDIRDALNFITEESGVNMVIAEEVKGNISLKLRQVPWDQALIMIMRAKKLGYTRQGNVLRIAPIVDLKAEEDDATKLAVARKDVEPLKVRMFPISYAKVDDLEKKLKDFLGTRGRAVGDVRTNSLVVTDIQENLDRVARLIASLDTQPAQVLIEGKIVEAKESFTRKIGVDWKSTGGSISLGNTSRGPVNMRPSFSVNQGGGSAPGQFNLGINIGTLDVLGDLTASLSLSEQEEQVKVISSPRIMAMSNEKADINQTTEVPIKQVTVNGNTTQETFQFKPLQLKLEVTPQVTSDGSVIMKVSVNRQFQGANVSATSEAFAVNSREANTKVLVKNGQTAVIGGIYQSDATDGEVGVPWFREIPVLGYLFKTKSIKKDKSELLIFLTPRILGQVDSGKNPSGTTTDL